MKFTYTKKLQRVGRRTLAVYLPSILREAGWKEGEYVIVEVDTEKKEVKIKRMGEEK